MSDSLGDMFVRFGGDTRQFDASMRHIQGQLNQIQAQSQRGGGFGSIFAGMTAGTLAANAITTALRAVGDGFKYIVSEGIKFNSIMQQNETAFGTMLGDMKEAKALMSSIKNFAAVTPLETTDLTQGAKLLLGYGVAAENIMPSLKMLGDVAQGDKNRMMSLALAFGQVMGNGRLMGQEVLQMVNAGFNPLQQISEDTGKSMVDLRKDMENGAVSARMVAEAFKSATSEGGRFYGAMSAQSKTYEGQLSTLRDNIRSTFGEVMKPIFDYLANNTLPWLINSLNNSNSTLGKLISGFKSFASFIANTVFPILADLGGLIKKTMEIASMLADPFISAGRFITESLQVAANSVIALANAAIWAKNKVGGGDTKGIEYFDINYTGSVSKQQKLISEKKDMQRIKLQRYNAAAKKSTAEQIAKYDWNKPFDFSKISNSTSDSAEKGLKKVKDTVAEQMKSVLNEVKSKAESIRDAFDIFSSPKMEKLSWKDLRYRMQKQLQMMEQWKAAMDKIGQRMGTESEIYRATLAQGPQAVGQAMALASMPDEFMNRFSDMYKQKQAIGMQFAAQQQAWQMKADNINQNITFNITEASDSDKIVQEVTKKFKLVGVM